MEYLKIKKICVVFEYIKSNLDKYISQINNELTSTPSENFVIKVYKQILNGLIYLKNKNVIHRNIKPSNMLLDDNNNVKISNFRLSAIINEQNSENQNKDKDLYFNNSIVGDPIYVSPEIKIIKNKKQYDYSCDIYSLGLTILCLISKGNPIKSNNDNTERNIDTQNINNGYNGYLKKLVIKMINEDPNARPNAKELLIELLNIEESINNKNDINTQIIKKNSDVGKIKNTSLIRVFQCLYDSIKENIKKIKSKIEFTSLNSPYKKQNDFISLDIINLMMKINLKDFDKIDKNEFINSMFNLRKKLSMKDKNFTGIEEVDPKIVIRELFQKVNSEFQNNHIFWANSIFNSLKELKDFPRDTFPEIYEKIDEFKEFQSPFINKFYFILLDLIKCPNCNNIIDILPNITFCLNISCSLKGKISKLINQSEDNSNKSYECKKCNYKGKGKKEISFINTPEYLIIYFEGKETKEKNLDSLLELSPYKISETGPELYNLYAFISNEENGQYIAYIKNEKSWDLYSNNYTTEKVRVESFNYCFPSIAIYKSIDK